jgi:hypothetical protein
MDETGWLACTDPSPMLDLLRGRASERKLRLFAVACYRRPHRVWNEPLMGSLFVSRQGDISREIVSPRTEERREEALSAAERCADGGASAEELADAISEQVPHATSPDAQTAAREGSQEAAAEVVRATHGPAAAQFHWVHPQNFWVGNDAEYQEMEAAHIAYLPAYSEERSVQCSLLRCIFGNPFRPISFDPSWRTPTVQSLAVAAYSDRQLPAGTFDAQRLAILADALLDAGCEDARIVGHLREGEHVRGCHVIDAILDRK